MTTDDIETRLVEAAGVIYRMPDSRAKPGTFKGSWPAFVHLFEDRVHWPDERHAEEADHRLRTASASRAAMGEAEEVAGWIIEHVKRDETRRAAWAWAMCAAGGRIEYGHKGETKRTGSFSFWCRNVEHISRQVGYERKDRALSDIVFAVVAKTTIGNPDIRGLQPGRGNRTNEGIIDKPTPKAWMAPDARPADIPEQRDFSWAAKQTERHKRLMAHLAGEEV